MRRFADRVDAGRQLGARLTGYRRCDPLVLGLPRGGVPVAYQVAAALGAELDVVVVRKLGVPGQPELAFGAIGEDGVRVLNDSVLRRMSLRTDDLAAVETREWAELQRRVDRYRGGPAGIGLDGRTVLIVDDGFATGATARAAAVVARARGAAQVVLAAPIGAATTVAGLREVADDVVCLGAPADFVAVGQGYDDFTQTSDDQVCALLAAAPGARFTPDPGQ